MSVPSSIPPVLSKVFELIASGDISVEDGQILHRMGMVEDYISKHGESIGIKELYNLLPATKIPKEEIGLTSGKEISAKDVEKISSTMPILSYLCHISSENNKLLLKGKRLLVILHFLKDIIPFIKCCERFGLDPKDTFIFYKEYLYPHKDEIKAYLQKHNYNVSPLESLNEVLLKSRDDFNSDAKPIIILEDGGYLVPLLHSDFNDIGDLTIGAMEQTTKGINSDKLVKEFKFPIYSMAESKLKIQFEPPYVAKSVINNIHRLLPDFDFAGMSALVIGCGHIGAQVANNLNMFLKMNVEVYDKDATKSLGVRSECGFSVSKLPDAASEKALIIGATGNTSLSRDDFLKMRHNTYLVSASSDQKEIGIAELEAMSSGKEDLLSYGRKIGTRYIMRGNEKYINLLGDGYPINFWADESMPNRVSDLIMSIILISLIDIAENHSQREKDISPKFVDDLVDRYKLSDLYMAFQGA